MSTTFVEPVTINGVLAGVAGFAIGEIVETTSPSVTGRTIRILGTLAVAGIVASVKPSGMVAIREFGVVPGAISGASFRQLA